MTTDGKLTKPDQSIQAGQDTPLDSSRECASWQIDPNAKLAIQDGGTLGNAILNSGSLVIENGGILAGFAEAGEEYLASDSQGTGRKIYGGVGNIIVHGGGSLATALIGPKSTLTVGDADADKDAPPALLGRVRTSGTVTIQNADVDIARDVDGGTGATSIGVIELSGGHTTITDSHIGNQLGNGRTSIVFVASKPGTELSTPYRLDVTGTTIDNTDRGIDAIQSAGNNRKYIVNLTDTQVLASSVGTALALRSAPGALTDPGPGPIVANVTGGILSGGIGLQVSALADGILLTTDKATILGHLDEKSDSSGTAASVAGPAKVLFDKRTTISGDTDGVAVHEGTVDPGSPYIAEGTSPVIAIRNGTEVEGKTGAAIHFSRTGSYSADPAIVEIASGSVLKGGNGNILQADGGGRAQVYVDDAALAGNIAASGDGSELQVYVRKNSGITGDAVADKGASVAVGVFDSTLTGDVAAKGAGSKAEAVLGAGGMVTGSINAADGGQVTLVGTQSSSLLSGSVSADKGTARVQLDGGARVTQGVRLRNDSIGDVFLRGNGTAITRADGAAIDVQGGSKVTVSLADGAQLSGRDDTLVNVAGGSDATVGMADTVIQGNMTKDAGSTLRVSLDQGASYTGNMAPDTLAVRNGAVWNMGDQAQASVGALSLENGRVNFDSSRTAFKTLTAASLQGHGVIGMGADFNASGGNDFLNVTGPLAGTPTLDVVEQDQGVADPRKLVPVAHTGGGEGELSLLGDKVDAGIYTYRLERNGNDWTLVRNGDAAPADPGQPEQPGEPAQPAPQDLSPAAQTALSMASALPWVWYGETATLRLRQGDLRANRAGDGAWVRTYSSFNRMAQAAAPAYGLDQYGLTAGADKRLSTGAGDIYVGGFGAYSYSTVGIDGGSSGRVNSYSLGGYATWLTDQGWYVDGVLKANEFDTDLRVVGSDGRGSRGSYRTPGLGATLEVGKHIALPNQGFIEPYTQVAGFLSKSAADTLDNGFNLQTGVTKSLQGEVGMLVGQTFSFSKDRFVQPYLKGALAHEFVASNRTVLNGREFTDDMSGTIMRVGVGVAAQAKTNLQIHLDADFSAGGPVDHNVGLTLGMRYVF